MRKLDTIGIRLCDEQALLFETSLSFSNISSLLFIKKFIYSNIASEMDDLISINYVFDVNKCLNEILGEREHSERKGVNYDKATMFWIGYIYRYWSYTREISSRQVYKLIKPSELAKLYFIYHSLDPEKVIDRIMEAKNIKDKFDIDDAVRMYREIINNRSK